LLILLAIQYQLDEVKFKSGWITCQALVNSLFTTNQFNVTELSQNCPVVNESDPCCNMQLAWYTPCLPREMYLALILCTTICFIDSSIPTTQYEANINSINTRCQNPSCIASIIQDYQQVLENEDNNVCQPSSQIDFITVKLVDQYQNCKSKAFDPITCYDDSNCQNSNTTCDLTTYTCLLSLQQQELAFIICLLETMDEFQMDFVKTQYNLSESNYTMMAQQLIDKFTTNDCISPMGFQNVSLRGHYEALIFGCGLDCTLGILYCTTYYELIINRNL
jgi:hypothetical protein